MRHQLFLIVLIGLSLAAARADSDLDRYAAEHSDAHLNATDVRNLGSPRPQGAAGAFPDETVFAYGAHQTPAIICALLRLTDIALEPGEQINGVHVGDAARWNLDAVTSGSPAGPIMHLIVKPLDAELETSLLISTDRRTYHLTLKSTASRYMSAVRFVYAENRLEEMNRRYARQAEEARDAADDAWPPAPPAADRGRGGRSVATPGKNRALNYAYDISGDEDVRPEQVYHDGIRTYIVMPAARRAQALPALLILAGGGHFWSADSTHVSNYRVRGRTFVVDGVIERARLTLGEGGDARQAEISFIG